MKTCQKQNFIPVRSNLVFTSFTVLDSSSLILKLIDNSDRKNPVKTGLLGTKEKFHFKQVSSIIVWNFFCKTTSFFRLRQYSLKTVFKGFTKLYAFLMIYKKK